MSGLILIVPLLAVMYFLMIRPQQQRIRAQQEAIRSVEVGDEVVTAAGLIGTIVALDDEVVHLEVADGVEVRVARMAIGRRLAEADVVSTTGHDLADETTSWPRATTISRSTTRRPTSSRPPPTPRTTTGPPTRPERQRRPSGPRGPA